MDGEGIKNSSNAESSGRFHTDWLNMIYPRLLKGRDMLADDGLIAISIDEHESGDIRLLCDEIFGVENLIAEIVWEKMYTTKNDAADLSNSHEYIFLYAKSSQSGMIGVAAAYS